MKILFFNIITILILLSCNEPKQTVRETQNISSTIDLPPCLDSLFRAYEKIIRPMIGKNDSIVYGLFFENLGSDSAIFSFTVYFTVEEASDYNLILGIANIDSIPLLLSIKTNEIVTNYKEINKGYYDYLSHRMPYKNEVNLTDIPCYRCFYYSCDSMKVFLTASSRAIPLKKMQMVDSL
jgi:hypothetical protein